MLKYHLFMIGYINLRKHRKIKFLMPFIKVFGLRQAIQFLNERKKRKQVLIGGKK